MKRFYRSTGAIAFGWLLGSCGGGGDGIVGPPPPPTTATVTMSADATTLVPAATFQLTATAKSASGQALSRTFAWSTTDGTKVTVSSSGLVSGVAPGTATVTAAVDGKSASATITVLDGGVVSSSGTTVNAQSGAVQIIVPADAVTSQTNLTVVPSTPAADPRVVKGTAFEFGPTGIEFKTPVVLRIKYVLGDLPAGTEEAALKIHLSKSSGGWEALPSSVDLSAKVVTAEVSHFSTYAVLVPMAVSAIEIRGPPVVGGEAALQVGASEQLTATLTASNGEILTDRAVTWASSNPAVASITAGGLVTAVAPGTSTLSASAGGVISNIALTVTPVPAASVTTSLASSSLIVGATTQATAVVRASNGDILTGRVVVWASSNPGVATVSADGTVSALSPGSADITATSEGKIGTASVTVAAIPVASVNVALSSNSITAVGTAQATATTVAANGAVLTGRSVTWSSSDPAVVTVSATGVVTAVSVGTANVVATSEGKSGNATITVTPAPVNSLALSPPDATLVVGASQQLTATVEDANHNVLIGRTIDWSTDAHEIATVSASGLVSAVSPGAATIAAVSEGKIATATITVTAVPVATVTVTLAAPSVVAGQATQATAATFDAGGNQLAGRSVTWTSENPAVAAVSSAGLVTSVSAGTANIIATSEGKTGQALLTVTAIPVPVTSITVSLTPNSITAVGTSQAAAVTLDANGAPLTGRAVTWSSSNTAVATVSAQGVVSAVAEGTANIVAGSEGKTGSALLTVTQAPVATVTVSPSSATLFQGATDQLTVVLQDAHGNVLSRPVIWSSSNNAVATVSTSGLVTAASGTMGTATITATSEGRTGTALITVSQVPVATVSVAVAPSTVNVGQNAQAAATLRDAGGSVLTGRTVTWTSDNTAVATVSSGGVVTALTEGTAHISAASGGQTGGATLTVTPMPVASVSVSLGASPIQVSQTTQATATTRDANNAVLTERIIVWSSENTDVAIVSASGLVTAIAAGSANITATSEGKNGSALLSVIPIPVASVTVSTPTTPMVVGQTQQLTATTKDANNNVLTGRLVAWTSSNQLAATVNASGLVTAVGGGSMTITATSETKIGTASITVTEPVATVTVDPASATLPVGSTHLLNATLKDINSNTLSGRIVTWSSSNQAIATVSSTGLVTAVATGNAVITAASEGKSGTSSIDVTPIPVASVTVGLFASIIHVGQTTQATATTRDAGNNVLTGRVVTWSSGNAAVATVSPTGVVSAVAPGTASIIATSEGQSGSATLTVNPAPVATVTVSTPTTPMIVGGTQQLTATTRDGSGNVLTGRTIAWTSSNTDVLTVTASGSPATVTAVGLGTATITATSESVSSSPTPTITVNPIPVASVTVSLAPTSITAVGTSQASATTLDANGNTLTGRVVTWSSNNTAVATVSSSGLVTAVSAGSANIIATSETKTGSAPLTVTPAPVATVTVSPVSATVVQGDTEQLTVTLRDAHDNVLTRPVIWTSSNSGVASVSSNGLVTAVSPGTATITATSEGQSATSSVTVSPVPVASVSVTLTSATITDAQTTQATATVLDADGNVLTGRTITWTSDNTAVATVSQTGVVTAMGPGSAHIQAATGGRTGNATLTVIPRVASVIVTPTSANVVVGSTLQLAVETRDAANNVLIGRSITWSSNASSVATVSTSGLVSGLTLGGATITATSEGQTGASSITVVQVPVALVTVSLASTVITVGQTTQATAMTRDAAGNILTGRSVTWSSGNPAVATVSAAGVVTSVAPGSVQIIATSETKTGSATLTVNPAPVATVTVSAPTTPMIVGGTQVLTTTVKDAANNSLTGRTVSWVSSNPAVLTVSPSSGTTGTTTVTAVGVGTATITATSESVSSTPTPTIAVNPVPVAAVTVSAPTTPMIVGQAQQLTATTKDANGNTLTGRTIAWVSSNTSVLTVSASGSPATVTAVAVGTATITATSESVSSAPTPTITVNPIPVATVTVSPATATLVLGITPTQQLSAATKDTNGNVLSGRTVTWTSSNNAVATVSSIGLVTAVAAGGPVTITATSEGQIGTSSITVTVAPVATVTVSPPTTPMIVGQAQQLTATTKDANGNTLTGRTITWVSSNTAVLTVSASGSPATVTAVGVGTATITATSESVSSSPTPTITVNPIPVANVTVSPATVSLVLGITPAQQLTAVTKDVNGNVLTGRTVTWSSSNSAAAAVSPTGLVTAVGAGSATITAASEGQSGTSSITVTLAPVATVTIAAPTTPMILGSTQQLNATTRDGAGNVVTGRTITWLSSNTAVLTVSAGGSPATVTAVGVGSATVTATSESVSSSPTPTITVNPVPVASVTVALAPNSITAVGTSQATATTLDSNGNALTGRVVTWSSSNTAVATVSSTGLVTGIAVGTASITATSEGKSGSSTITVTQAPVATVTVSLAASSIDAVQTTQATVTLLDSQGRALTGRTVGWTSDNAGVATVSTTGLVTAVSPGSANIIATSEGKSGSAPLTVTPAPVALVTVTPASATLVLGVTPTQQLTAVTKDVNGGVLTGRTVTWTSSNNAVATVNTTGLVTAVAAGGPVTITATSETKTGTSSITVSIAPVAAVTVSAPTTPMIVGATQVLTATVKDAADNTLSGRTVSWVSSNTAVLTVSPASGTSGTTTVTAVGVGTAMITATSESVSSSPTPTISVNPIPVATVTVTPTTATLVVGITPTQQLSAVTRDANGNVLTGRTVTWTSSNNAVATVSATGLVTAVTAGGPVTITATSEGQIGTSSTTVTAAPVATVTVSAPSTPMIVGQTQQLTATTKDANGNTLAGRTISWVSSNTTVLTVSAAGSPATVTAVGVGTATITATSESVSSSPTPTITVNPIPVASVTVSPNAATLVLGITPTQQLTAETKDSNGNVLTGRSVSWVSDNPAAATVDANGLATAVAAGSATITATSEGQAGASAITVTVAPVASVTVSLAPTSITAVGTSQATATTLDANGNTLTGRTITWTSDNTAVATVSATTGVVTGVSVGTASITATSEGQSGSATITVTQAPVATVTVALAASSINAVQATQATATLLDSQGRALTGRAITWASDNESVATVSSAGLVTPVAPGSANITATSETKSGSAPITVTPAPVANVTVTPSSASLVLGINPTQQLTAVTKDANGVVLTGRAVTWSSSNNTVAIVSATGLVEGVAGGGPVTVTAMSEGVPGTSSITVTVPDNYASLLHVSTSGNRRYFQNAFGQPVYLTGSHTWSNLQDNGTVDPPAAFNYTAYLNFLETRNHNFFRLWTWEQAKWTAEIEADYWITPGPFQRTGPEVALDGKPKFDVTQFNQAYFDRIRSRVQAAAARGMYVSIMLFDGWSVGQKGSHTLNNPWKGHPFNAANNINSINGDSDSDGNGLETQTLDISAVTAIQDAYVRRVIDAVGDLDNVLYEISNESDPSSRDWQYHMIQVIRNYEATRSKQHPIGMTAMWPSGSDADLFGSNADWISITGDPDAPPTASGTKVLITDTDHLCGICGSVSWVWKSFAKGHNPILMDGYDGAAIGMGAADYNQSDSIWEEIRRNLGYARAYALRMDLANAVPHGDKVLEINGGFVPTGYALAKLGSQYLVFIPGGGSVTLDLSEVTGTLSVEWLDPSSGVATQAGTVTGGPSRTLTAPFGGNAVLFLH